MMVEILVLIGFIAPFAVLAGGWNRPRARGGLALLSGLYPVVALAFMYRRTLTVTYAHLGFLNIDLSLRITPLAWLFGIASAVIGLLAMIYSLSYMRGRPGLNLYYFLFTLVNGAIIGVVMSGDLVTFYIAWEIMSIATFLLISFRGGDALRAGLKYILFSIAGSAAMLIGLVSLYVSFGTLAIAALPAALAGAPLGYAVFVLLMFSIAFGIKNALLPLHPWLPDAYVASPDPFTAVLGGMLTRLGVYGFLLMVYVIIGLTRVGTMSYGPVGYQIVLAWIAAATILFGVFVAVFHDDAKRMLAWSSIGHGGYMILGLAVYSALGLAGGIFHAFNYAMSVALLFLAVGAVEYRTGTRDLTELGGLVARMPVTFASALIAVLGMIGVPLTSGFVSKWLIYKGLILGGHPFLAFIALIGTWGTVLYGYKLIHNAFLGRMPARYADVEEVPWGMRIPMIVLAGLIVLFGIMPGIPLTAVSAIEAQFGVDAIRTGLVGMPEGVGELNLLNIFGGVLAAGLAIYAIFSLTAKPRRLGPQDTYTAGAPTPEDGYNYTARFYDPAQRLLAPYLQDGISSFYDWLGERALSLFNVARKMYSGDVNTYALWIVVLLGVLVVMNLVGWRP